MPSSLALVEKGGRAPVASRGKGRRAHATRWNIRTNGASAPCALFRVSPWGHKRSAYLRHPRTIPGRFAEQCQRKVREALAEDLRLVDVPVGHGRFRVTGCPGYFTHPLVGRRRAALAGSQDVYR